MATIGVNNFHYVAGYRNRLPRIQWLAGARGVMWVILTFLAFVDMGLFGGGAVEVARDMGVEIYGNKPGVTMIIAGAVGFVTVKNADAFVQALEKVKTRTTISGACFCLQLIFRKKKNSLTYY